MDGSRSRRGGTSLNETGGMLKLEWNYTTLREFAVPWCLEVNYTSLGRGRTFPQRDLSSNQADALKGAM